jgi:hypothetical protein
MTKNALRIPYSYAPYLPQTESEVKSVVEDLTQKLRLEGMARRQQFELLQVNLRLSQMIDVSTESLKTAIDEEVLTQSIEMEKRMAAMLEQP